MKAMVIFQPKVSGNHEILSEIKKSDQSIGKGQQLLIKLLKNKISIKHNIFNSVLLFVLKFTLQHNQVPTQN
jgi:hypothetical protein